MPQSHSKPSTIKKISVLMPAFNECHHIMGNLMEVVATFERFALDFEIVVIDDGSADNTYLHAARAAIRHPDRIRVIRCDLNGGKGNALVSGTRYASGDCVVFLDADMDLHPAQLTNFFEIMEHEGADAVIGSKWHPESRVTYPLIRKFYSFGYFALVRALFQLPLRDTQTGLKLFRTELLRTVFPRAVSKRFCFDVELLAIAHRLGYKIVDAPVHLEFRRTLGRLRFPVVLSMLAETLVIFFRLRIKKCYDVTPASSAFWEMRAGYEVKPSELRSLEAGDLNYH